MLLNTGVKWLRAVINWKYIIGQAISHSEERVLKSSLSNWLSSKYFITFKRMGVEEIGR